MVIVFSVAMKVVSSWKMLGSRPVPLLLSISFVDDLIYAKLHIDTRRVVEKDSLFFQLSLRIVS
jgi:hypothetical protein